MLNAVGGDVPDRCGKFEGREIRRGKNEGRNYTASRNSLNWKVIVHAVGIRAYILDRMEEHGRQYHTAVSLLVLLSVSICIQA